MLTRLGRLAEEWTLSSNPWTNVYGCARTLLALGTVGTLLANPPAVLFRPAAGLPEVPFCSGPPAIGVFCVLGDQHLEVARWLSIALLLVVASGWRPRLTGVLHWWIAFSLQASAITIDGGDQVTAVLTALLIPVTLTDPRNWHWRISPFPADIGTGTSYLACRLVALASFVVIRLQVAVIYFHAAVGKMSVAEWVDGTALYYWWTDPAFGLRGWLKAAMTGVLSGPGVGLLTWGVVILELVLAMALVMPKPAWKPLLAIGMLFHIVIALTMGLTSFGFAMFAALLLYLRPVEQPLVLRVPSRFVELFERVAAGSIRSRSLSRLLRYRPLVL
jgi:antimicrobial peptide system SdpB family protein